MPHVQPPARAPKQPSLDRPGMPRRDRAVWLHDVGIACQEWRDARHASLEKEARLGALWAEGKAHHRE